ncbi:MAG TPA: hypothetical protein PLD25_17445 [Chloroflexota bacterium]|nr:hypothetical protein [Chloroflexota bacterium]
MKHSISLRFLFVLTWLLALVLLAACSAEPEVEPTPILPPPNVNVGEIGTPVGGGGDTAVSPTLEPGQVISGTAVPDAASTPEATPTLAATATETGPPAATPVTNPPVQAISGAPLPTISRDLLFLADGALKRWNQRTQQIEVVLPGPVPAARVRENANQWNPVVGDMTDFSVSADGKRAVAARLTAVIPVTRTNTLGGNEYPDVDTQHELWFTDLVSNETWRIVSRVDNLRGLALSPDARHVAFQGASLDGNYAVQPSGELVLHVYFLPTGGGAPGSITNAATCNRYCGGLAWHPDNNLFVWNDNTAVWLQNLAGRESEQLIPNRPFNEQAPDIANVAVYSPIAWANNGRYLLLWKGGWEGGSRAVFDVPTKSLVDVPDTAVYVNEFPTEVMWMPDARLFVLRSETGTGAFQPRAELWRFQPEQNTIVKEESVVLSNQNVGAAGGQHLDDGRFAYVLFAQDALNTGAGAYHLVSFNETPERVNASPPVPFMPGTATAFWSKDGYGVLIMTQEYGRVYYAQADGDYLYDVTAVLGAEPHAFHWQPEIVVP